MKNHLSQKLDTDWGPVVGIQDLLCSLERAEKRTYSAAFTIKKNDNGAIYGGQLIAQCLAAASETIPELEAKSLFCYFLRAGSVERAIEFEVIELRKGRNIASCRVKACQGGEVILEMLCSFSAPQDGFDHQIRIDDLPQPEDAPDLSEIARQGGDDLPTWVRSFAGEKPIAVRPISRSEAVQATGSTRRRYWARAPSASAARSPRLQHKLALAYLSDFWLNGAALAPHSHPSPDELLFCASISHAIYFHRPVRADDWLLFDTDSPSACGGISLSRGLIYDRHGTLAATVTQEALQTPWRPASR